MYRNVNKNIIENKDSPRGNSSIISIQREEKKEKRCFYKI